MLLRRLSVLPWRSERSLLHPLFFFVSPKYSQRNSSSKDCHDLDDLFDPPFSSISRNPKLARFGNGGANDPLHSDLPFDFQYSYSETDRSVQPLGFREKPRFSPFGPGRLDRTWNGVCAPAKAVADEEQSAAARAAVLGDPLSESEIEELVERYRHDDCSRQINIGKGGVTHNLLDDIHNHWRRAEAVRIKCLGTPTLDMDNVCFHLEEKTGGKIIYRKINILLLYRGRYYDHRKRPTIPLMLWKPRAPIYPRLVKNTAEGLNFEETKEMRSRGLDSPALMTLTRNGVYVNVVEKVKEAFKTKEVIRLDCSHVETSDIKKIGVKLRDLVPCVPILFKKGQIILWRRKDQKQDHQESIIHHTIDDVHNLEIKDTG
ncbi:RNA-binding CRS1 / YhbY (CRM) domain-containing protein [Wolffia australiana]